LTKVLIYKEDRNFKYWGKSYQECLYLLEVITLFFHEKFRAFI